MAPSTTYIPPASDEMLRLTGAELKAQAAGRPSKKQAAAEAEIARRKANKAAKRATAA